jgi:XTP/dITP diphosphohydrolase
VVATHNSGKLEEIGALFAGHPVEIVGAAALDLPVPEETETTFVGQCAAEGRGGGGGDGSPCPCR